jgi:hypothetical protein
MRIRPAIVLSISVIACYGALYAAPSPVGRVISGEMIEINGIKSPAHNYMPVSVGAEIATHGSSATIQFGDGSTVLVNANSQIRIDSNMPYVRVVRGAALVNNGAKLSGPVRPVLSPSPVSGPGLTVGLRKPVSPVTFASTGGFAPFRSAPGSSSVSGIFSTLDVTSSGALTAQIITPSGLTFQVQSTDGGKTFQVIAIQVPVTYQTSTGTANTLYSVTSGNSLIGATVSGITTTTTSGSTITPTFAVNNQVVTGTTLSNDLTNAALTSIQNVSTQNGGVSTFTGVSTNVTTGTFSSNAH